MSYRKLTVNDKNYDYVIGSSVVKVRDVSGAKPRILGVWDKAEIGYDNGDTIEVHPKHIADRIRSVTETVL